MSLRLCCALRNLADERRREAQKAIQSVRLLDRHSALLLGFVSASNGYFLPSSCFDKVRVPNFELDCVVELQELA